MGASVGRGAELAPVDIGVLHKNLADATKHYEEAQEESRRADRRRTDALNRLNDAQKQFDAAVEKVKKDAPMHSDWSSRKQMRYSDA